MIKDILIKNVSYLQEIPLDEKLCNQVCDNQIIDLITMDVLPVKINTKQLVMVILLESENIIVHDLMSIKIWLEKHQPYREPLTNLPLPSDLLQRIRDVVGLHQRLKPVIRWGLRKSNQTLINGSVKSFISDDTPYLIVGYIHGNRYYLWSLDCARELVRLPQTIVQDIEFIMSGGTVSEYDYNIKRFRVLDGSDGVQLVLPLGFQLYELAKLRGFIRKHKCVVFITQFQMSPKLKNSLVALVNDWSRFSQVNFVEDFTTSVI